MFKLDCRPTILYIRNNLGFGLSGAEIGVNKGLNAKSILELLKPRILYAIDSWESFELDGKEIIGEAQYDITKFILKDYSNVKIIREDSIKASHSIDSDYLDFVYIDACHAYGSCLQDINVWSDKVKRNGVVGGHDYHITVPGVVKAVDEYTRKHNKHLFVSVTDWWFVK